jgi:hypothetical protein
MKLLDAGIILNGFQPGGPWKILPDKDSNYNQEQGYEQEEKTPA